MEDYQHTIQLKTDANQVFNALTKEIPLWWTEMFEGASNKKGQFFTVRFGENVFKMMEVKELVANTKVEWNVKDSLIAIPELKNQSEWIGTSIIWEIKPSSTLTVLKLTHKGLNQGIECYDICSEGWQQFINSLRTYIETGKGNPFKSLGK